MAGEGAAEDPYCVPGQGVALESKIIAGAWRHINLVGGRIVRGFYVQVSGVRCDAPYASDVYGIISVLHYGNGQQSVHVYKGVLALEPLIDYTGWRAYCCRGSEYVECKKCGDGYGEYENCPAVCRQILHSALRARPMCLVVHVPPDAPKTRCDTLSLAVA